jgi:hypothetical protein
MSHIVEAKTKITCPNVGEFLRQFRQGGPSSVAHLPFIALLRQAVLMVAREHGGTIEPYYLDFDGEEHATNTGIALHIPQQANTPRNHALERGIGLSIDETTGVLTFIGDPYRVEEFYAAMQRQIVQTYAALAYSVSMRLENYQQVAVRVVQESLVVSGEIYA